MLKELLTLFLTFAKVGVMTFGGGYAMLPILQREVVENKGWATDEELTDYFAIGQCTPGVIAVNTATFIGQKRRGILGGIAATLGVVFPSLVIIAALAGVITTFSHLAWVQHAFAGIRVCVCVLIFNAVLKLWKGAVKDVWGLVIFLVILALLIVLGLAIFALMCKLCLAPAALVLENIGVMEGISRSWTLTRGYFWRIVGIRLLSFIIVFFASQIVSQGVSIVMQGLLYAAPDMTLAILVASTLLSSLVQAAILPFDSAVVALMYTDLRMRSEGLDVELRHAAGV